MNKARLLLLLVFAAGILVAPGHTQEMPKTAAKPAPSASEAVLEQWNEIGRKLIAMAEDFPEDKYDFKPTPAVRSFAERLIHAAYANQCPNGRIESHTRGGRGADIVRAVPNRFLGNFEFAIPLDRTTVITFEWILNSPERGGGSELLPPLCFTNLP